VVLGIGALGVGALSGCSGDDDATPAASSSPTAATAGASATAGATAITVRDPWIKTADTGNSALFGTLVNGGDKELTVVSGTSTAAAMVELHEVVKVDGKMVMRPKTGGYVVPANGTHELAPGADHVMLMHLTKPIKAGDEVTVTLTLSDGSTVTITAMAKPFAGGGESYAPKMG
jgi:hypothetical protein